jgi:osmoprotectant transport system permease protein
LKLLVTISFLLSVYHSPCQTIVVGAKHFNEGYILSEIIAQLLESNGFPVERKYNLGGTMVCYSALKEGEIDIYPEYTGTLSFEILKSGKDLSFQEINVALDKSGLVLSGPYGFNNTYALISTQPFSDRNAVTSISDLTNHTELTIGLSYEFLKRQDGWENLAKTYSLKNEPVGLEHGLAYEALIENKIDITDAYSTDGEIIRYDLKILEDDKKFFPNYYAASFYRKDLDNKAKELIAQLDSQITKEEMQAMNAAVIFQKKSFSEVASDFLNKKGLSRKAVTTSGSIPADISRKTLTHLKLTFISLLIAVVVAIPMGIILYWNPVIAKYILYGIGLLQTIPSIALLALLIPLTGIGVVPAIIALFLYALLPIVRNTYTGLETVDPVLKKVAVGMGMNRAQQMRLLELPLALPQILTGIRTAAVISVGTATLAAFVGAGGLGEYIVAGLALNNTSLIMRGAVPAAVLAIIIELLFELVEKTTRPAYLKKS